MCLVHIPFVNPSASVVVSIPNRYAIAAFAHRTALDRFTYHVARLYDVPLFARLRNNGIWLTDVYRSLTSHHGSISVPPVVVFSSFHHSST